MGGRKGRFLDLAFAAGLLAPRVGAAPGSAPDSADGEVAAALVDGVYAAERDE